MEKYELVPYRESPIPEILKKDVPDDIKIKEIIQHLHSLLHPAMNVKETPSEVTREEGTSDSIVDFFSKGYKLRAKNILRILEPTISWDRKTFEIIVNGQAQENTNIVDLVYYLVTRAKSVQRPPFFHQLLPLLVKLNLPTSIVHPSRLEKQSAEGEVNIRPRSETPQSPPLTRARKRARQLTWTPY